MQPDTPCEVHPEPYSVRGGGAAPNRSPGYLHGSQGPVLRLSTSPRLRRSLPSLDQEVIGGGRSALRVLHRLHIHGSLTYRTTNTPQPHPAVGEYWCPPLGGGYSLL